MEQGEPKVYKPVDVTDNNPNGRLQLLKIQDIPAVLHHVHVSVLGYAGQDKTFAEVSHWMTAVCTTQQSSNAHANSHKYSQESGCLQLKLQYFGFPLQETVAFMIKHCGNCNQRQAKNTRAPLRPIKCESFLSRLQIDLIDMRAMEADGFSWIQVLKDHFTRFTVLFALQNKEAATVKAKVTYSPEC